MEKFDMLRQSAAKILDGLQIYICARNEDAGLRDPKVELKIRHAYDALITQMRKYNKKK